MCCINNLIACGHANPTFSTRLAVLNVASAAAASGVGMTKKIGKKSVRRPGRPTGDRATRETILDIAEQEFALRGFAGTSLREIAERAEVNQALINYYFGTKQKLFGEVFKRRGLQITNRRLELDRKSTRLNSSH